MAKSFTETAEGSTMGYIHCCGGLRKTRTFRLLPQDNFVLCELDYLFKCPICGHTTIQITRINNDNEISTIRKYNKKALKLFEKIKNKILYEEKNANCTGRYQGRFYLYYNEYGIRKKCFSNLRNLKLGKKSLI